MTKESGNKLYDHLHYRWERWNGGYRFGLYEPVGTGPAMSLPQKIHEWSKPYTHADNMKLAMNAHADGWRQCFRELTKDTK